ncbi:hypothetical protein [Streptomyces noursei]|uniref:hypothetical protein n=1 Tax=Streptomyces noursei TaxID=1971 RepID=UPI0038132BE5
MPGVFSGWWRNGASTTDRTLLFFLATTAIGVLASLWPGRQAARIPMLKAITTDTE